MAFGIILGIVFAAVWGVNSVAMWILCAAAGLSLLPAFLQRPIGLKTRKRKLPQSDEGGVSEEGTAPPT